MDMLDLIVVAARIRHDLYPVVLSALRFEIKPCLLVGGKDGGGRAELRAHIGDDMSIHRRQRAQSLSVIFDDPADAAGDAAPTQQLQDDILGAHPGRQRPVSSTPNMRGAVIA